MELAVLTEPIYAFWEARNQRTVEPIPYRYDLSTGFISDRRNARSNRSGFKIVEQIFVGAAP